MSFILMLRNKKRRQQAVKPSIDPNAPPIVPSWSPPYLATFVLAPLAGVMFLLSYISAKSWEETGAFIGAGFLVVIIMSTLCFCSYTRFTVKKNKILEIIRKRALMKPKPVAKQSVPTLLGTEFRNVDPAEKYQCKVQTPTSEAMPEVTEADTQT